MLTARVGMKEIWCRCYLRMSASTLTVCAMKYVYHRTNLVYNSV